MRRFEEMKSRNRFYIALLGTVSTLLFAVAVARLALDSSRIENIDRIGVRKKQFNRTLVEELTVSKHGYYGIDFVKCGSCRIEKRRKGLLTFGGLNVLVIDGLQVVLPPNMKDACLSQGDSGQRSSEAHSIVGSLGVSDGFLARHGLPRKFSGLSIKALSVNRLSEDGRSVEKVFEADKAEAARKGLLLSGCTIFANRDSGEFVGDAMCSKVGDELRLVWQGGEIRL